MKTKADSKSREKGVRYLIGIDEAGRGPLAGPVAVGVACVPREFDWGMLPAVTDSKKLSEKKREEIFKEVKKIEKRGHVFVSVAMVGPKLIDTIGIVPSIEKALSRALTRTLTRTLPSSNRSDLLLDEVEVLLDGGLRAPERFIHQKTIIRGDQKEKVIGLASIVAKVTRDRYMERISRRKMYAQYGFDVHKGYGTKVHRECISKYGVSDIHRVTYCKNVDVL